MCAFVLGAASECITQSGEPGCQLYNAGDSYTHYVNGGDAKIECWNKRNRCPVIISYFALDKNGQKLTTGTLACTFNKTAKKTLNPNGIEKIKIVNNGGVSCGDWVAVWN